MNGSTVSIILITVAFTAFVFIITFIITSLVGKNKIAAEKRIETLKSASSELDDISLVKHETKSAKRRKKENASRQNNWFDRIGTKLYKELRAADINLRPEEFILIWLVIAIVPSSLVALFLMNNTVALILLIAGIVLPVFYVKRLQKSRVKKFEVQLSDALIISCSCLRSGLSFSQAMETMAKDMDAPISTEFGYVLAEMSMGASMDEALENLGQRIKSPYVELMISAVLVQRQTGGNLSQILETLSNTIKDRMKLKQELKSATASGRMTGMIVGLLPVILLGLFTMISYDYVECLYTTTRGNILLVVAAALEIICFFVMRKISSVKM